VNDNNLPMIKKEGIFYKIKKWLKNLFNREKVIESKIEELTNPEKIDKSTFIESIKVKSNDVILSLQIKLEKGEIGIKDLSDDELDEMIELYNKKIEDKKKILEHKLSSYKN